MNRLLASTAIAACLSCASCAWLGIGWGANGKCDKQTLNEIASPAGDRKAVVVRSTCEYRDTKWSSTAIEVSGKIGDTNVTEDIFGATNAKSITSPALRLDWKSDSELWVVYPSGYFTSCNNAQQLGVTVHCAD